MFEYQQSIYDIHLKFNKDNFEYYVDKVNGIRQEYSGITKISTCKSLFTENDNYLDLSNFYINDLKKLLKFIQKTMILENTDFSAYVNLHNEKILIDNSKKDNRSYGFIRLIYKNDKSIFASEIPINKSNPENLEDFIKHNVNINKHNFRLKQNSLKHQIFKSMPVILSSQAAGYFIHEILGHTLEEDFYSNYKENYKNLKFPNKLNVVDSNERYSNITGIHKYDDKGIEIQPLTLVKNGEINNVFAIEKLNSFNNKSYGCARRASYKHDILPRMRCTYMLPCDDMDLQKFFQEYENSVFIDQVYFGGMNPYTGDYSITGIGFLIKNGEKQNFVDNLKLSGNFYNDFLCFDKIGNDFKVFGSHCTKFGQTLRIGIGAPTVSVLGLKVEGDIYE